MCIKKIKEKIIETIEYRQSEKRYAKYLSGSPDILECWDDSQLSDEHELLKRGRYYSILLKSYVEHYRENQYKKSQKKWHFYYIVITAFIVVLLLLIALSVLVTIFYRENKAAVITSYITSFIGLFSSLTVIPHTIVKYLFNPQEDELIANLVIEMQKQDLHNKELNNKNKKVRVKIKKAKEKGNRCPKKLQSSQK